MDACLTASYDSLPFDVDKRIVYGWVCLMLVYYGVRLSLFWGQSPMVFNEKSFAFFIFSKFFH